jgi:hypothetical protein
MHAWGDAFQWSQMPFTVKRLRMDVGMKKKKNPA